MNHPKGLTVDDKGNIYIADTMNMAIRKISDAGKCYTCIVKHSLCQSEIFTYKFFIYFFPGQILALCLFPLLDQDTFWGFIQS